MNQVSVGEGASQLFQWRANGRDMLKDSFRRQDRDVVLGEVDAGFEQRDQLYQFLLDRLQAAGECSPKLLGCDPGLVKGLRLDQVVNGFSLCEIEASVEKRTHGEFTWLGKASAASESKLNNMAQNHGRAVGGDFDDVVGRVGVGLSKVGNNDFVNGGIKGRA